MDSNGQFLLTFYYILTLLIDKLLFEFKIKHASDKGKIWTNLLPILTKPVYVSKHCLRITQTYPSLCVLVAMF